MKLNLRQLFDIVGERKEFQCSFDFSGEELYGGFPFQGPVDCSGEIENHAGVVRLVFLCEICPGFGLRSVFEAIQTGFYHAFRGISWSKNSIPTMTTTWSAPMEFWIWRIPCGQDVLLELPGKVLCSEDCKGLCCQCGKNLNEGSCTCEKKTD